MVRLGNVLADFIGRNERIGLSPQVQAGIALHRKIDTFTDSNEIVERSKAKLVGFKRYGNALIDVFYDHFLSNAWEHELAVPDFTGQLYDSIKANLIHVPETCNWIANRMIEQDWLSNYGSINGLHLNLSRMESRIQNRTGRVVDLVSSLDILEEHYDDFQTDFLEYWPKLRNHVWEW